ncbi:MAG: PQQ-binding-like beta-propeller repeat protein [Verrucomicrobia bacterium]|nr:PQQ-binding-like beta-propeller repeat protein [Verrucomicrobiota bacterium]
MTSLTLQRLPSASQATVLAGLLLLPLRPTAASVGDWPTYRHDRTRSGATSEKLALPLALRWVHEPVHAPQTAWHMPAEEQPRMHFDSAYHVAIAGGMVFSASSVDNQVYALNQKDGTVRWTFFTGGPVRCAPTVSADRVYVGSDDGYVYCLGARPGNLIWKYRPGPSDEKILGNGRMVSVWPVRTGVLVEEGVVYFGAGVFPHDGLFVCALKAADGSVVWKNDTAGDRPFETSYGGMSPQGYLLTSKNNLFVPSGRAMPAVFDRHDGRLLRFLAPGGKVGGTWALLDQDQLLAGVDRSGAPAKVAYNEKTGEREGDAYAWFPGIDLVVTPAASYILTEQGVTAIDRARYAELAGRRKEIDQEQQTLAKTFSDLRKKLKDADEPTRQDINRQLAEITARTPVLNDEVNRLRGVVLRWRSALENLSTLILADKTIFAGGEGTVLALDAQTGQRVWSAPVTGKALGLAVANGDLFVSTDRGPVYCFGSGGAGASKSARQSTRANPEIKDASAPIYESTAERIVRETGIKAGFALVLGAEDGRLALALAKRTNLKIVALEQDAAKLQHARQLLSQAGVYGARVVVEAWELTNLPDYFANLIVSDELLSSGRISYSAAEMFRVLRPHGGVAYLGQPGNAREPSKALPRDQLIAWLKSTGGSQPVVDERDGFWAKLTRGDLEGEGNWTQLYGNGANTACSDDLLVEGPLGPLWYGEPGSERVLDRHARAAGPLCLDGRLFIQGNEVVMGVDAYNGTVLWQREIPGAVRVRVDVDGSNLSAGKDGLYVAAHDQCYRLDPATGETLKIFHLPPVAEELPPASATGSPARRWSYVARAGSLLYGSASPPLKSDYGSLWKTVAVGGKWKLPEPISEEFAEFYESYFKGFLRRYPEPNEQAFGEMHRAGLLWRLMDAFPSWGSEKTPATSLQQKMMVSDSLFALNPETGAIQWSYLGRRMGNTSFTIADGLILFLEDAPNAAQRAEASAEKQRLIQAGKYEEGGEAKLSAEQTDVRMLVALDALTGQKRWEKPIDITGCGGFRAGLAYQDGVVLCFGHFSNHDRDLFNTGSLTWRRVTAVDASRGETLWSRPLNYLRRPLVVGDSIIVEPRMCDLRTGQIKMRTHPITGEQTPWEFYRAGHSCSVTTASARSLFFRSYNDAFYDLSSDRGVSYFGGIRTGCWVNYIAANGLLLIPESSSGCTCSFPLRTTVALKSRKQKQQRDWTVFIGQNPTTPVKHLAVNLGAPGDMRDDQGTLWFGYPRPAVAYGVKFKLNEQVQPGLGFFATDFKGVQIPGTDKPWLYTTGCRGLEKCEIELLSETEEGAPAVYTLRLGFLAPEGDRAGQRVFDIKVQGRVVAAAFDASRAGGGPGRACVKELRGVKVTKNLVIELIPKAAEPSADQAPVLCHLEAIREEVAAKAVGQ